MSLKGFAIPSLFSLVRSCMMCPESPLSSAHSLAGWELQNTWDNFDFICSTRSTPVLMRWLVKRIVWWWTSTLQTWHRTASLTLSWSATYLAKGKGLKPSFCLTRCGSMEEVSLQEATLLLFMEHLHLLIGISIWFLFDPFSKRRGVSCHQLQAWPIRFLQSWGWKGPSSKL